MTRGPIDFVMVRFSDHSASSNVAHGLKSLVDAGTIRIIDLIFVAVDSESEVAVTELSDLADDDEYSEWNDIVDEVDGLLTEEDAILLAEQLEPGNSAVLVLYENSWARAMSAIITEAHGEVMISDRIPRSVIDQLLPS